MESDGDPTLPTAEIELQLVMSLTFGGYLFLILLVLLHRLCLALYFDVFLRIHTERHLPPPQKIIHPRDTSYIFQEDLPDDDNSHDQQAAERETQLVFPFLSLPPLFLSSLPLLSSSSLPSSSSSFVS